MLKAVIFDMDGVIIDSEPMHARAALLAFEKYSKAITLEYVTSFIGSTTYYMCKKAAEDFHLNVSLEELLQENNQMKAYLLKTEGHTVIPYIIELMRDLHHNGIKLIIASSSSCEEIEEVIEALSISQYLDGYVSGTTVARPKPAPDIFLAAAKALITAPEECIVIEDSCNGVHAAYDAGITCVGFRNPNSGNQDLSKAALLVEGFEEVNYAFLKNFYNSIHTSKLITKTDKFIIRELAESDIPALFEIYQQPGIRQFTEGITQNLETEKEKHKAYIKNIYHFYGYGLWGVFLEDSQKLIGRCGIEFKMLDGEEIYELGYLIRQEYQGMGYAFEFVHEVIHYCFQELQIPRIVAVIYKENIRSISLARRLGLKQYGICIRNKQEFFKYELLRSGVGLS